MNSRRHFIRIASYAGAAMLVAGRAQAQALPMVDEKDPLAVSLGYVSDNTKAGPPHAAGQMCGNCLLYQGPANSASGPCPLFAGKQVSSKGWCKSYTKKP